MDGGAIKSFLKEEIGIKKDIVALKRLKEEPSALEEYEGKSTICFMMQEALEENKVFYTTIKNRMCLGCVATGMDRVPGELREEELKQSVSFPVEAVNTFQSIESAVKAEREAVRLFPKFNELYRATVIGPIESVKEPEILIIFCNPEQANLLTRAYCYVTGTFIKGYAGIGACRMILPDAFVNKEPTITVSDRTWRIALKLSPDLLTLVTPYDKLMIMFENLERSKVGGPNQEAFEQAR
jgi:uncharacterized protein (DUF169 family)